MRYLKLATFLTLLACIALQAQAQDLLNPIALGESMSMPLPPDLVRQAENAGVKVGTAVTGALPEETSGQTPVTLGSGAANSDTTSAAPWSGAGANAADANTAGASTEPSASEDPVALPDVNVSGMWTFTLQDDLIRRLDLALFQNGNAILGYGNLASENNTQGVTAGGSMANGKVNLLITSQGGLSMYRLDLTPSESSLSGSYSAFTSSGDTWSGTASGSIPGQQPKTRSGAELGTEVQSPLESTAQSGLAPAKLGSVSSTGTGVKTGTASSGLSSSYGSSGRIGSSYSSGGMSSSSQSISIGGGGGSYSSVSSLSSAVYG